MKRGEKRRGEGEEERSSREKRSKQAAAKEEKQRKSTISQISEPLSPLLSHSALLHCSYVCVVCGKRFLLLLTWSLLSCTALASCRLLPFLCSALAHRWDMYRQRKQRHRAVRCVQAQPQDWDKQMRERREGEGEEKGRRAREEKR
jgi:hypothetical protein